MTPNPETLKKLRDALDDADRTLFEALDARVVALEALRKSAADAPGDFVEKERVVELIARAKESLKHFKGPAVDAVVREIFYASESHFAPLPVAFAGSEGDAAHFAARQHFGTTARFSGLASEGDVVDAVAKHVSRRGVLLFETSVDGTNRHTLEALVRGDISVVAEIAIPTANDEQARAKFVEEYSQHRAESGDRRYVIVGTDRAPRAQKNRTMIAFSVHDEAGALHRALAPFADRDVNLTRLESRAIDALPWKSAFFVEVDGHVTDRAIALAVEELRSTCRWIKVLGSYPLAV